MRAHMSADTARIYNDAPFCPSARPANLAGDRVKILLAQGFQLVVTAEEWQQIIAVTDAAFEKAKVLAA